MFNFLRIEVLTTTSILVEARMTDMRYIFPTVKEIKLTMERSRRCNLFVMAYFFKKFSFCERLFINVRGWIQTPLANGGGDGNHTLEQQQPPPLIPWPS
ncbi:hypothetical protein LINGRAPRIM_LOCUS761 [Linum grandiflorum]